MTTTTTSTRPGIRTPDQRLRVFVSSTLRELAPERAAVRRSIERLAAAPVMFELGARPHPPRELYRAYLEQSDIFVGLYWEKYGWVAPGEEVSGLEDEYNLAPPEMPRLIYIKESGAREPRLSELLDRIRSDDRASFKYFRDADELGELLIADLAILLAERFDLSRSPAPVPRAAESAGEAARPEPASFSLPRPLTRLFGRESDLEALRAELRDPEVRLVTVLGPGGIGKSRLAIEAARSMAPEFRDGVVFVPLAAVENAARVPDAVAQALALRDLGELPVEQALAQALRKRDLLLVLDNFEQVLDAGSFVSRLLEATDGVKIVITSRTLLRIGAERSLEVAPLELPPESLRWPPPTPLPASVALLVDRARAVRPDFEVTAQNLDALSGIALRLDGVPLAIELAAARLRVLPPATLLERLDHQLTLLVGGRRDLPSRQQTARSTIEWSTKLLQEDERELLWRLGVFAGPFPLEAAEALAEDSGDALALLEALADASLVRQHERSGRTYFLLLGIVREYALEQLGLSGRLEEMQDRHARFFLDLALAAGPQLLGAGQRDRARALSEQRDNLRAAARRLAEQSRWEELTEFAWALLPYCWIDGLLREARDWMRRVLASEAPLPERTRAVAISLAEAVFFWREPTPQIIADLTESADILERDGYASEAGTALVSLAIAYMTVTSSDPDRAAAALERALRLARRSGNRWGESIALTTYGGLLLRQEQTDRAVELFQAGMRLADDQDDYLLRVMARNNLAWAHLVRRELRRAAELFDEVLQDSIRMRHDQGIASSFEGLFGIAAVLGDPERAGILEGAAEELRSRVGVSDHSEGAVALLAQVRADGNDELFDRGVSLGRSMTVEEAIAVAEEVTRGVEEEHP